MDSGDTAWILTASALVLLMTPGVAFFYGGMVRGKSVLNMMMMSFGAMGIVGVIWVLWGYPMAFGSDIGGFMGNPFDGFGLEKYIGELSGTIPTMAFIAFQATFAIITVALISGSVADRTKFSTWLVFAGAWVTLAYLPIAHWVWGGGWLSELGAIDFAGGTVVHINAGIAGLVFAIMLGKRKGWGKDPMRPHNLPFVMLGAALLWFGWFGFNAGSELAADDTASVVWVNTMVATCAAMLAWLATEKIRDGKATSLGAASGVVAGLVAITPACASVSPIGAVLVGLIAGIVCALAVGLKWKLGYDDSLDVVGVHLVGGLTGTLLIGFLGVDGVGLFYGGGLKQLGIQAVAALAALAYSGVVTAIILAVLKPTMGLRSTEEVEVSGDQAMHGETAYETLGVGRVSTEVKA